MELPCFPYVKLLVYSPDGTGGIDSERGIEKDAKRDDKQKKGHHYLKVVLQSWMEVWKLDGGLGVGWRPGSWMEVWELDGGLGVGWKSGSWMEVWELDGGLGVGWRSGNWMEVWELDGSLGVGWRSGSWMEA